MQKTSYLVGGLLLAAILGLSGCSWTSETQGVAAETAEQQQRQRAVAAIEAAEQAIEATRNQTGGAGVSEAATSSLQQAKAKLEAGDHQAARQAAEQAEAQAKQDLAQYQQEHRVQRQEVANGVLVVNGADPHDLYQVGQGDTLWGIAGASAVYDDPFAWPVIYKANRPRIEDPDLIYPDQEFTIERGLSSQEMDTAVEHARNRGEWRLGEPNASDLEYLNRSLQ